MSLFIRHPTVTIVYFPNIIPMHLNEIRTVMSSEDRNFRYGYYEKVGFGGIEEKKSIEFLLEKPSDLLTRFAHLTSRYSLSSVQRKKAYQLVLDVTRPENQITECRLEIQREIVQDILNGLVAMGMIDSSLTSNIDAVDYSLDGHPKILVLIFLLESKQLSLDSIIQVEVIDLLSISEVFTKEFLQQNTPHSLEDTYWIFKHFINCVQSNLGCLVETYEKFVQHLANEDKTLHVHLVKNAIIRQSNTSTNNSSSTFHSAQQQHSSLQLSSNYGCSSRQNTFLKYKIVSYRPIITWFVRFFAGIIHHTFLIRVLDRVISCLIHGSRPFYVLISLGKALIMHSREQLLMLTTTDDLVKRLLLPLSIEESEKIVVKALSS